MGEFKTAAKLSEINVGSAKRIEIDSVEIALFNIDGTIYAINDVCTHRQCSLSEGFIEGNAITCPCHLSVFDIKTGKVLEPPALVDVQTYKVLVQNNDIEVEV